jgi:hypothetical protein
VLVPKFSSAMRAGEIILQKTLVSQCFSTVRLFGIAQAKWKLFANLTIKKMKGT